MRIGRDAMRLARELRRDYAFLKIDLTPREAVALLANKRAMDMERVRFLISFARKRRICRRCWLMYAHKTKHGLRKPHLCDPCYHIYQCEAQKRNTERYRRPLESRKRHDHFMKPDELRRFALRSLKMTSQQFGEALADVVVNPTHGNG